VLALTTALLGCGPAATSSRHDSVDRHDKVDLNALYVNLASRDLNRSPLLRERILADAHGYFRFINPEFAQYVCNHFSETLASIPTVNLHGDAHLEQYAVTEVGRGLTDFDMTAAGPAMLDLIRFGTSIWLTVTVAGGDAVQARKLVDRFFDGYQTALAAPDTVIEEPTIAKRIRATFSTDRRLVLEQADRLMLPVAREREDFEAALVQYAQMMRTDHPELAESFFTVKKFGRLKIGIGSALDEKYLIRIEGPTADDGDDKLLEAKEVKDLSGISCVQGRPDAFRIMVGQSRLSYQPYRYLGYAKSADTVFWFHGWTDNYRELSFTTLTNYDELGEVVYDVGVQLGIGHPKQIASPLDAQLRRALIEYLDDQRKPLHLLIKDMTTLVTSAWQKAASDLRAASQEN